PDRHAATSSDSRFAGPSGLDAPVIGTPSARRRLQPTSDAHDLEVRVLEEIEHLLAAEVRAGRDLDVAPLGLGLEPVVVVDPVLPGAARAARGRELEVDADGVGRREIDAPLELARLGLEHDAAEDDRRLAPLDH